MDFVSDRLFTGERFRLLTLVDSLSRESPAIEVGQGLDNQLLASGVGVGAVVGKIECRERLGGMLRYYYRTAA